MEEYKFLMEQQGRYITQSNNLQQYDNRITSAPLGRCRGIINMNFSSEEKNITFFPPPITLKFTFLHDPIFRIFRIATYEW